MTIKILNKKNHKRLSILFLAIAILNFFTSSLFASEENEYGINRIRTCSSGVADNEFSNTGLFDKEFFVDLTNTACLVKAVAGYAAVKLSIHIAATQCGVDYSFSLAPQPWNDVKAMVLCNGKAVSGSSSCKASAGAMDTTLASFFIEMAITKKIAQENYDNTKICGDGWVNARDPNNVTAELTGEKKTRATEVYESLRTKAIDFNDQKHREWYYDGIEVEDKPVDEAYCIDPTINTKPPQKYYMRGLMSGNFNCDKYNDKKYGKDPVNLQD